MTDEELNNLISQTDIVSLVSKYVTLEKFGKNYKGLCPFHNEKTPSFVVSPDKGLATCFGCHKGGNALTFLKEIENVEYKDAIRMLCEFNGVEYKSDTPKKINPNLKYYEIMSTAKEFYKVYLNQDKSGIDALNYLRQRGLSDELIDKFDIGLSPQIGSVIHDVLLKSGYLELDMQDLGLIGRNQSGKYYDIFSSRIMFPIKDELGNTLGFSGRIFNSNDKNQAKYVNTQDTKIFLKGDILFNLNLAKSAINKKHRVILHEGQMDVIAAYSAGFEEAVCSLGTALTPRQVAKLKKYTDSVIICYDGDKAGVNSSLKAIDLFSKQGFKVHLVLLPDNMDPDEYVKKYGKEEYQKYFEEHIVDSIEYRYNVAFMNKNLTDKVELDNLRNEVFSLVLGLNSAILEENYLSRFAKSLNVSIDAVRNDFSSFRETFVPKRSYDVDEPYPLDVLDIPLDFEEQPPKISEPKKPFKNLSEIRIFIYAKKSKELAKQIDNRIMDSFSALSKENQSLWLALINDYYENFDTFDEGLFVRSLSEADMNQYLYINEFLSKEPTEYNVKDLDMCINEINKMGLEAQNKILNKKAKETLDETEKVRLLDQVFQNKKRKNKKMY